MRNRKKDKEKKHPLIRVNSLIERDKPLLWRCDTVQTPPFSASARIQAGHLLRLLQKGESLAMPDSRPMPVIGARCHELRITDDDKIWRIIYRIDADAIVIVAIFQKATKTTPKNEIAKAQKILKEYDHANRKETKT